MAAQRGDTEEERALALLVSTLRVYSPSTKEEKLSLLLRDEMRKRGFRDVRTDPAFNAIGEIGGEAPGGPRVLLCGHMDTVPGFLGVRTDETAGVIHGRGAADAKGAMCAMLSAASSLRDRSGLSVTLACVTREEGDSLGVKTLIEGSKRGAYDYAIFGEPAGAAKLTVGYRGRVGVAISVRTHGGHASSSWAHPSAVDEAIAIIPALKRYEAEHAAKEGNKDHYRSLSASLTMIRGGSYSNVVPQRCVMTYDVRIPPGMTSTTVKGELTSLVEEAHRGAREGVEMSLEFGETTEPYDTPLDSTIIRAMQRSILKTLNTRPILTHKTGTGDMNTFAELTGVPCVTYGPGDSNLAHTDSERIEVKDYLGSIRVLKGALEEVRLLHGAT